MGYYTTTWGKGELEEMMRRWQGHLKNAKTPEARANAREQLLKLQEAYRFQMSHKKSDSRRRAPSKRVLGMPVKSGVWRI